MVKDQTRPVLLLVLIVMKTSSTGYYIAWQSDMLSAMFFHQIYNFRGQGGRFDQV
jgi:hypothetical protein